MPKKISGEKFLEVPNQIQLIQELNFKLERVNHIFEEEIMLSSLRTRRFFRLSDGVIEILLLIIGLRISSSYPSSAARYVLQSVPGRLQ